MSVGVLMILLISELYSFDDFHVRKDNIYRVTTTKTVVLEEDRNYASASIYIGNQIEEQVPAAEKTLIMRRIESADLKAEEGAIAINGFYVSRSFFDVFSFKLIKGNPQTALSDPNSIVLTESSSKKLFGDRDPIGQLVNVESDQDTKTGKITGVVENPPINSHIRFEALMSLKTLDYSVIDHERNLKNDPEDIWSNYVYIVLNKNAKKEQVEYAIAKIMTDHNSGTEAPITHFLQPLSSVVTDDFYHNVPGPSFSQDKIHIMIGLTLIVLLSACFNYTNLSLARALRRSKEVSIRKATGATRFQVFAQFMVEAVILAVLALIVGLGLFFLFKPEFLDLPNPTARGHRMFMLDIDYSKLLYFLLLAIGVGCAAGLLPATFLSKIKSSTVFNDANKVRLSSGIKVRRLLITFQFVMSISLIMGAVLVHKQYKFALNYDLGYVTENIVNVKVKGDYADLLKNEYAKIPEVVETSSSSVILGTGGGSIGVAQSEDRSNSVMFLLNNIDEKYLDMHGFKLLAGSASLPEPEGGEKPKYIVVNEEFLKKLNLGSPAEAIGKSIWYNDNNLTIWGVVRDFVSISLTMKLDGSFAFVQPDSINRYQFLGVKMLGDNFATTMEKLEERYKEIDPVHPFEATFYDDRIAETYQQHKATYTIISFLAFLAISISTMGLLGMVVFITESRMKEISIRKVLGAGVRSLMMLFSRAFLVMIAVAGLVAIPITLYIVDNMVLNEFLYRAQTGLIEALSGFAIVIVISALTIGWQIRAAATRNPADLLRNE